ncbi:hypothetical protein [Longimicrobium terrae]|uniref:Uncharacterized protein n=1 Tax=Longimicrobium terrae TaxID=1639882 RepID=A0A841GY96_9BACT|nr:hypothetical protein [Longimicrobium terrae]MBB4636312.1 hypothetical protein [Longimicrobium terrae]MBB6070708.1 hypothetical protein [Longimicrobium terrae]NNC29688.1 hypothetical protein [Longimicrobium terrae]
MKKSWYLVAVLLVASACEPRPVQTTIPPVTVSRTMSDAAETGREAGPGVRYIGPGEVDPAIRESAGAVHARIADRMAGEAAARSQQWRTVPVAIALTDEALLSGAVAVLVRDPAGRGSRMLIFSRESLDDESFILADLALRRDEIANPSITGRRIMFVTRDQRIFNESGAEEPRLSMQNLSRGSSAFAARLREAPSAGDVLVPGVGRVTVLAPVP